MTLKSQNSRVYRGLIWVGRIYRWTGWLGLGATVFAMTFAFIHHLKMLWNYSSLTRFDSILQALLIGFIFLILGLVLSAIAFGISLGIQVGLTMMENSQIKVDLLRRIAQQQGESDSVLRLSENGVSVEENLPQSVVGRQIRHQSKLS